MTHKIALGDKTFRKMISAEEIDKAVSRVADQLNEHYAGRTPIFLGMLNGSFLFFADLVRKVDFNGQVAFMRISSYSGTESTGKVVCQFELDIDIEGRDIIIVEDIVDTGHSMSYVLDYLKAKNPASIAICTLFFKPESFRYDYKVDYVALNIGNEFIVGYGLDYDQLGRNLKDVYVIDE